MDQPKTEALRKPDRTRLRLPSGAKAWIIGAAALALIAWAGSWLVHRWTHIYVDDARIDGEIVTIASRVSGWLVELTVIEGDEVKKDQVIARVDSRDSVLQREVLQARLKTIESQMGVIRAQTGQVDQETLGRVETESSRLAATEAEIASADANLKQARQDHDRAAQVQKYISAQEMEKARTALQQAQEARRKALADAAAARGAVSVAGGSRKQVGVSSNSSCWRARPRRSAPRCSGRKWTSATARSEVRLMDAS
jgi:membrane fusion protein (multidrug efflux system)